MSANRKSVPETGWVYGHTMKLEVGSMGLRAEVLTYCVGNDEELLYG